jgi:hypothetical protein
VLTYSLRDPVTEREVATGMLRLTEPIKVKHQGGFSLLDMKHFVETRGLQGVGYPFYTFNGPWWREASHALFTLRVMVRGTLIISTYWGDKKIQFS